jgi:hypothetical protein
MKCCVDNLVRLRSCIRNINKHFWHHYQGGSQYLLSVYRLHGIILTSIISLTDLSAVWLFVVVTGKCFVGPKSPTIDHSFLRFTLRFISMELLGFLIRQGSKKSNQRDPRMSFKQLADDTFIEAWERSHGFMIDLPTPAWKIGNSPMDFTVGCHKKLRAHRCPCWRNILHGQPRRSASSFREAFC